MLLNSKSSRENDVIRDAFISGMQPSGVWLDLLTALEVARPLGEARQLPGFPGAADEYAVSAATLFKPTDKHFLTIIKTAAYPCKQRRRWLR